MSDPYVGEIRAVGFAFAPPGWAMCNGQTMSISQNPTLFNVIGTTYGGNGTSTFALPDLRGTFSLHANAGSGAPGLSRIEIGETGGSSTVALTTQHLPTHSHLPQAAAGAGTTTSPTGASWAVAHIGRATDPLYSSSGGTAPMNAQALATTGGGQAHENMPPFLVVNFIIALQGIFPPQ